MNTDIPNPADLTRMPEGMHNPLRPLGRVLLKNAACFLALSLAGWAVAPWFGTATVALAALSAGLAGTYAWFAVVPESAKRTPPLRLPVRDLLGRLQGSHDYLGAYRAEGLWQSVLCRTVPVYQMQSPRLRRALDVVLQSVVGLAFVAVVAGFGLYHLPAGRTGGTSFLLAALLLGAALGSAWVAAGLVRAVRRSLPERPVVPELTGDDREIRDAGNPVALIEHLHHTGVPLLGDVTGGQVRHEAGRIDTDAPGVAWNGWIAVETTPRIVPQPGRDSCASATERYGFWLGLLGGVLAFADWSELLGIDGCNTRLLLIAGACLSMGVRLYHCAARLRGIDRYVSDLFRIDIRGTVSHERATRLGAEVRTVKSELYANFVCLRAISEPGTHPIEVGRSSLGGPVRALEGLPERTVIGCVPDAEGLGERLDEFVDAACRYRDRAAVVRGIDTRSPGLEELARAQTRDRIDEALIGKMTAEELLRLRSPNAPASLEALLEAVEAIPLGSGGFDLFVPDSLTFNGKPTTGERALKLIEPILAEKNLSLVRSEPVTAGLRRRYAPKSLPG